MDKVTVTQADRRAAEAFWQEHGPTRMGTVPELSQAFAHHRIAALEEAAKVAERKASEAFEYAKFYETGTSLHDEMRSCGHTANEVATAIRALKEQP